MQMILRSEETQRRGVVSIMYGVDAKINSLMDFSMPSSRFMTTLTECFLAVPIRIDCFHMITDDIRLKSMLYLFRLALGMTV